MGNNGITPYSSQIAQASGMVSVQAVCDFDAAIVLMKARAVRLHRTLDQVATGVLDRSIRFGE